MPDRWQERLQTTLAEALRPLLSALRDLAPIVVVIAFFQLAVLRRPAAELAPMLEGLGFVWIGLALFVRGLEIGLFPIGEAMAQAFVQRGSLPILLAFSFLLGFTTTVAEPALIAIAAKAAEVAAGAGWIEASKSAQARFALELRLVVALSVGCAVLLGVLRILFGWPLHWMIIAGYAIVTAITPLAPPELVGIAYDAGGVTTSTITVPLVTALGVGLASAIQGRSPLLDGFGLIAFASLLPMIFVLAWGSWLQ